MEYPLASHTQEVRAVNSSRPRAEPLLDHLLEKTIKKLVGLLSMCLLCGAQLKLRFNETHGLIIFAFAHFSLTLSVIEFGLYRSLCKWEGGISVCPSPVGSKQSHNVPLQERPRC